MRAYKLIPVLVFLIAFITYLFTLTPTVDFIDSGELAAVACTLGVAHPTGYPLFTLLGNLFSRIPFAASRVYRLNVMSAFFAALAAAFFTLLIKFLLPELTKKSRPSRGRNRKSPDPKTPPREGPEWLVAGVSGLLLAWSAVLWETGTTLEVYSLHACFTVILLYLSFKFLIEEGEKKTTGFGLLFFLTLGFSFANHLTTVTLLPAFGFIFLLKIIKSKIPLKRIILIVLPVLVGLALYLYLPIRAQSRPAVMWGEVTSWPAFFKHLSAADFQSRFFAHQADGESFLKFLGRLPRRTGYLAIPLILTGIFLLFKEKKKYFFLITAALVPTTIYAATYNIPDNLYYYAPTMVCLLIYFAVGADRLFTLRLGKLKRGLPSFLLVPLLTLPPLFINYEDVDKSDNYFVEDFIRNLFSAIEPNAILFALDVHIFIHPLYYYQNVENFRTDVAVLSNHGLQKGWLARQLAYLHPEIYRRSEREIADYLSYLAQVEDGQPHDPRVLDRKYFRMLASIISQNHGERPIYITSEFNPEQNPFFHPGYRRVPEGLAWRLYRMDEQPRAFPYREFAYRDLTYPHKDADAARHAYMYMLKERGVYEAIRGDTETALKWIDQGIRVHPPEELLSDTYNGRWVVPNRLRDLRETRKKVEKSDG